MAKRYYVLHVPTGNILWWREAEENIFDFYWAGIECILNEEYWSTIYYGGGPLRWPKDRWNDFLKSPKMHKKKRVDFSLFYSKEKAKTVIDYIANWGKKPSWPYHSFISPIYKEEFEIITK